MAAPPSLAGHREMEMFKIIGTACNLTFLVWVLAGQPALASLTVNGGGGNGTAANITTFAIDGIELATAGR